MQQLLAKYEYIVQKQISKISASDIYEVTFRIKIYLINHKSGQQDKPSAGPAVLQGPRVPLGGFVQRRSFVTMSTLLPVNQ